ncbi:MAG: transglutaminase domain-containing protein [Oscillospiraceae bacterium]|nr:transglutaminase domain-containing protein [Oscillospiraceae bacterium]
MSEHKFQKGLTAFFLSFCLGFGGVACMVTGLGLRADPVVLGLGCALISALACFMLSLPKSGWAIPAMIAVFGVLLWRSDIYRESWRDMLQSVFRFYEMAYSFPVPRFLVGPPVEGHLAPLLTVHCLVCLVVSWLLLRRYPVAMGIFLSLVPVAACFVVTDTVPALWCVLIWLFGLVLVVMTHTVRLRDEDQALRLTRLLALPVAAALAVLCLAVPQKNYVPKDIAQSFEALWTRVEQWIPFLSTTSDGGFVISFGGKLADKVDLQTLGPRTQRPTPVMEMETTFSGLLYLRGRDHDVYDGVSWSASTGRVEEDFALPMGWRYTRGTVKLTQLGKRDHLYIPTYPVVSPKITDGMVLNSAGTTEQVFDCITLIGNWEHLWRQQNFSTTPISRNYLELPQDTMTEAQKILLDHKVAAGDTVATAKAIGQFVEASARYDLQTQRMPQDRKDLAIWFLQEADRGYCVHFATAATVLLRAAGIPARYVEGYLVQAQEGRVSLVRESAAHAWTEYYVDGVGWMILDATPGSAVAPTEPTETTEVTQPETTEPTQPETTAPTQPSATRPTESVPVVTTPGPAEPQAQGPVWLLPLLKGVLSFLLWTGGLTGLAVGQWYLRRKRLLDRMRRGKVNAQALARYRECKRLSRLTGIPVPDAIDALGQKACFSQHKATPEELARLDATLAESVGTLKGKGLWQRLYYRLVWVAY